MPATEDYYALLRVSRSADAAAIQAAYRALMRRYHPDVNASVNAATKAKAINEAYACLRDASKRVAYDRQRTPISRNQWSTYPSSPSRRPRPVWHGPTPRAEPSAPWFQPTWGKAVGLGIAAVITSITFTITSATPPAEPSIAKPVLEVTMRISPKAPTIADAADRDCRSRRTSAVRAIQTKCGSWHRAEAPVSSVNEEEGLRTAPGR